MHGVIIVVTVCYVYFSQRLGVLDGGQRLSDQKQFDTIFRNCEFLHPLFIQFLCFCIYQPFLA